MEKMRTMVQQIHSEIEGATNPWAQHPWLSNERVASAISDCRAPSPVRVGFVLHVMQVAGAEILVAETIRRLGGLIRPTIFCLDAVGPLGEQLRTKELKWSALGAARDETGASPGGWRSDPGPGDRRAPRPPVHAILLRRPGAGSRRRPAALNSHRTRPPLSRPRLPHPASNESACAGPFRRCRQRLLPFQRRQSWSDRWLRRRPHRGHRERH